MLREAIGKHYIGMNKEFRFRGEEPGRLENFSDAVFALAITLLLISTNAPADFDQLKMFVWGLIPFCVSIILIILIWHEHFVFFYRYGLRNSKIILLNSIFLMIVLFYVYPLKFLWKLLILYPIARIVHQPNLLAEVSGMVKAADLPELMIIYGLGCASIFFILMLMYRYALTNRNLLELNKLEEFHTRTRMTINLIMGGIPLLSACVAWLFSHYEFGGMISGLIYFLYMPAMYLYGSHTKNRRKRLMNEIRDETTLIS